MDVDAISMRSSSSRKNSEFHSRHASLLGANSGGNGVAAEMDIEDLVAPAPASRQVHLHFHHHARNNANSNLTTDTFANNNNVNSFENDLRLGERPDEEAAAEDDFREAGSESIRLQGVKADLPLASPLWGEPGKTLPNINSLLNLDELEYPSSAAGHLASNGTSSAAAATSSKAISPSASGISLNRLSLNPLLPLSIQRAVSAVSSTDNHHAHIHPPEAPSPPNHSTTSNGVIPSRSSVLKLLPSSSFSTTTTNDAQDAVAPDTTSALPLSAASFASSSSSSSSSLTIELPGPPNLTPREVMLVEELKEAQPRVQVRLSSVSPRSHVCPNCRRKDCPVSAPPVGYFSESQVSSHCTPGDLWITSEEIVYDVSRYLSRHPGGTNAILQRAGLDASQDFAFHTSRAKRIWNSLRVGRLARCPYPAYHHRSRSIPAEEGERRAGDSCVAM